jgi:hypothetical protein
MGGKRSVPFAFVACVVAASSVAVASLSGQTPEQAGTGWIQPKTPWGDPDLQGLWSYATLTPLERPAQWADRPTITEQEAAEYQRQSEERSRRNNATAGPDWWDARTMVNGRTSLIVDPPNGRLPPLTPEAQANAARSRAQRNESGPENVEEIAVKDRCLYWEIAGPPMLPGVYNNNVQLVQTPGYVVIVNEMIHDARIVPLDQPHGAQPRWMGDSRGRWEGNTLVVDTIHFTDKTRFRGTNASLHLIERFTRLSEHSLEYRFTVDAPATWTQPWTASVPMTRTSGPMFEYACHEGNTRSLTGILSGARYVERNTTGR